MTDKKGKTRAILLLSGGLDSSLALKITMDLGIEVEALNFFTIFCNCVRKKKEGCIHYAQKLCKEWSVPIKTVNITEEFLEVVKKPRHGYGSGMNPCIDCRILMHKKAREYMEEKGAQFIITGEVLGQRPMSQRLRALKMIEKESGLQGLILRPLSARLLEPTLPEQKGLVDREALLALQGRTRKPQMALAKEVGLADYPCPAGGCLLTDKTFSKRLRDLFTHQPEAGLREVMTLKHGRHFRLSPTLKVIVGRDEADNGWLLDHHDGQPIFEAVDFLGPVTIAFSQGRPLSPQEEELIASITARYGKGREQAEVLVKCSNGQGHEKILRVSPRVRDEQLASWLIG